MGNDENKLQDMNESTKALVRKDLAKAKQDGGKRIKLIRKLLNKPEYARSDEEQDRLVELMGNIEYFQKR